MSNCTCNSRTVDDSWNLIHSDDCELNKQTAMKRQLATEWLIEQIDSVKPNQFCSLETIKGLVEQSKQKEIENLEDALTSALSKAFMACQDGYDITTKEIINDTKETYGIDG